MFDADIRSFLVVALLVVATPGPDMLLIAKHTFRDGRRGGLTVGYGICVGVFVHALGAAVGLSALLAASATAFEVVRIAGALFLIYLGLSSLSRARRGKVLDPTSRESSGDVGSARVVIEGVITNVLNPEIALLFLSFIPQFVDREGWVLGQTVFLSTLFIAISVVWVTGYVLALARFGPRVLEALNARGIDVVAGLALTGLGLRILIGNR